MTREEEMLSEAKKHYSDNIRCYDAFLHGVEFAEEHPKDVWHDPDEEPKDAKDLLLIDTKGCVWVGYISLTKGSPRWKAYVQKGKVAKWAYVEDLLH